MLRNIITTSTVFFSMLIFSANSAQAGGHDWKVKMIADAITAAPPSVTNDATIYAWDKKGQMILLRPGTGPYVCLASGFQSTRVGKPSLPYPDPMCLDQNAWNFMRHVLSEKNPMKPSRPYPTAPGLVWMLSGMALKGGMVDLGSSDTKVEVTVAKSGVKIVRISPHLMIMPVPGNEKSAGMATKYNTANQGARRIRREKTPIEQ